MMHAFTKYLEASGNITGNGSMPATHAAEQPCGVGEAVFVGQALHPSTHYFAGGQPVAYTPAQARAKADRPAHASRWCNTTMAWLDERTAQQRAADDVAAIRLARRNAYPSVADQLDALWHAMQQGQLPMVPEFFGPLQQVKAAHPKP